MPTQIGELEAKVLAGRHGDRFALDLSEHDLAAMATNYLASNPEIPFRDVRVSVSGDRIVADAVATVLFARVPVHGVGVLGARGGLPTMRVESLTLGNTSLPGFVSGRIIDEVNRNLDFSRYDLAITVERLEMQPGRILLEGFLK